MRLKDFVLAVFKEGKKPEDLEGIERCTNLGQIESLMEVHDSASLYCVYRESKSVTVSRIKRYYQNSNLHGRFEGELELGCYGEFEGSYHLITKREVGRDSLNQGFIKQKDLVDRENYIEKGL